MATPIARSRSAVSRLTLTKLHHPERTDFTELEQDCVVERAEYAIRKMFDQYGLTALRPEQVDRLNALLTGAEQ